MFIVTALLSFEAPHFDLPPDSVICAQREAKGTNDIGGWQIKIQGPIKWTLLLLLIPYDYTNGSHYTMCNREKMTL